MVGQDDCCFYVTLYSALCHKETNFVLNFQPAGQSFNNIIYTKLLRFKLPAQIPLYFALRKNQTDVPVKKVFLQKLRQPGLAGKAYIWSAKKISRTESVRLIIHNPMNMYEN